MQLTAKLAHPTLPYGMQADPGQRLGNTLPFYTDDAQFIADLAAFVLSGIHNNEPVLVILSRAHVHAIQITLQAQLGKVAYAAYLHQGTCVVLEAEGTLERISHQGWPTEEQFNDVIGHAVARLQQHNDRPIRGFGKMIAMLCAQGKPHAAVQLEKLWHALALRQRFSTLQDYPLCAFEMQMPNRAMHGLAASHSAPHNVVRAHCDSPGKDSTPLPQHVPTTHAPEEALTTRQDLEMMLAEREQRLAEQTLMLNIAQAQLQGEIKKCQEHEHKLSHMQYVQNIAQQTAHVGSWEVDLKTELVHASDEFFRICGLTPQSKQLDLAYTQSIVHPEDRDIADRALRISLEEKKPYKVEKRIIRPDNTIRHILSQGELILNSEQEVKRAIGSFLDITDLREAEAALRESHIKLRQLAAHQEKSKEEERIRIARELHDELGGLLTGIKAYVSLLLATEIKADTKAAELLRDASGIADMAMQAVQRIVNDLRPSILDQLGIWAAIRWYAERFVQSTGVTCTCQIDEAVEDMAFDIEPSTLLFRICQEALTNVTRHSQASVVTIRAYCQSGALIIEINDNGKGFDSRTLHDRTSWGISGMYERVHQFDGDIRIASEVGAGTLVTLSLRLEKLLYDQEKNNGIIG